MPIARKLQDFLDRSGVKYEHTMHPRAYTAREVAAAEHLPAREVAKTVIVWADDFRMIVLPANRAVDLSEVRAALGIAHARLATEHEVGDLFPDCELGAMPPFGSLYGMPVFVDEGLALDEMIAFNAGTHTDVIHMRFEDYQRLAQAVILPLAREMEFQRGW